MPTAIQQIEIEQAAQSLEIYFSEVSEANKGQKILFANLGCDGLFSRISDNAVVFTFEVDEDRDFIAEQIYSTLVRNEIYGFSIL